MKTSKLRFLSQQAPAVGRVTAVREAAQQSKTPGSASPELLRQGSEAVPPKCPQGMPGDGAPWDWVNAGLGRVLLYLHPNKGRSGSMSWPALLRTGSNGTGGCYPVAGQVALQLAAQKMTRTPPAAAADTHPPEASHSAGREGSSARCSARARPPW